MIVRNYDIILNRAAATRIPFISQFADGSLFDLSGQVITFQVKGGFALTPELDASEPRGRVLHFTKAHAASLDYCPVAYHVLMTSGGEDQLLWSGKISVGGFA